MKNLKAIGAAALAAALSFSLVACASDAASSSTAASGAADDASSSVVEDGTAETTGAAAMGFGLIANAGSGDAKTTANTIAAAVLVDEAGAIVDVELDIAQCYVYSEGGVWGAPEAYLTKTELGDDYGMGAISGLEKGEWFEQVAAFKAYVTGMTAADVAAIGIDPDSSVTTDADLLAGCTIKVNEFVDAVLLAMENATEYNCTVADTLNLVMSTPVATGTDATADKDGKVQLATTVAVLVVSPEGVVNDLYLDVTQPDFTNTAADAITGEGEVLSKQQLQDGYGMAAASSLENGEWFQQCGAFMDYVRGMNAADLGSIAYDDAFHATDADLLAGCTIKINGYVDILVKAAG